MINVIYVLMSKSITWSITHYVMSLSIVYNLEL